MKGKKSSRTVPLHPKAKQALQEYLNTLSTMEPKTRLFPFTRQHCHRILKGAFNKCKLEGKVTTHSLRKHFASKVHKALGENIFKTQQALGHASPSSTVHYLSFDQAEISEAILGT
jgi:integrase